MILYTRISDKSQTDRFPLEGPFEKVTKRFEFSKFWNPEKLVGKPEYHRSKANIAGRF